MIQKLQKAWMTMAVTALVLCGFAVSSQAQDLNTVWERVLVDNTLPEWFAADTERGLGYGNVGGNDRLYIASRAGGAVAVRIVDAATGNDIGTLPLGDGIITGGTFGINDAEVSDDGKIFAANLSVTVLESADVPNPFKVYMWNDETSDPVNVISFLGPVAVRLGDKFTVTGSVDDGTAIIWAASSTATQPLVYKFSMVDGAFSAVPEVITLSEGAIGGSAAVGPLPNGDFWHNSNGQSARKYSANGTFIGAIPGSILTTGSNSIRHIGEDDDNEHVVSFQYGDGQERVVLMTVPKTNFDATTVVTTRSLRQVANGNGAGAVDVNVHDDGEVDIFYLSTNHGIAAYSTAEPTPAPELFTEYFEYPIGSLLVDNGWTAHSGAGTNSPAVVDRTLSYEGYAGSGIGNVVGMTTGEDVHRNTGTYTSGTVYASALVNLSAVTTSGDYFLHFSPETIGFDNRARVYAIGDGANNVAFGISKAGGVATADVTGFNYALNQTILLVLEYQFVEDGDDVANLYVNPVGSELPGTPDVTDNVGADLTDLGSIALRQAAGNAATLVIGNLRVGSDYAEVVGDPAPPAIPSNYVASLSGLNEVPANLSAGMGEITLVLTDDELVVTGTFSGLGSDYTVSHIHAAAAGTNGGVVVPLTPTLDVDNRGGTYEAAGNTFTLTQDQIDAMAAGQYYVNVHSVVLPAGELRGQIYTDPNTAPSQVAITAPADGASVTIEGNPLTPFAATWETATDAEGHPVNYIWQLAADDQFETIVVNANVGSATSFTTDFQTVDALLAGAGVADGGSIMVYQRTIATDGSLLTAGTSASVTITRGELDEPITIAEARGVAIGEPVFVEGIITTPDFGFNSAEFYVQDSTAGIKVRWVGFGGGNTNTPFAEGQLVRLAGTIDQRFDELLIGPSGYDIISSGNDLPEAVDIARTDWTINTPLQGSRVKVSGLSLVDPTQWPTSAITTGSGVTVQAQDADSNIYDIRIDRDESEFEASPLPPTVFNLSGVLGRFEENAQLFPFFADELEGVFEPLAGDYYVPQGTNEQGFSTLAMAIDAVNQAGLADHATILIDADLDEGSTILRINRGDLTADTRLTIKPAPGKQVSVHAADFRLVDTGFITVDGSADGDDTRDLTFVKNSSAGGFISLFSSTVNVELKNFNVTYDENYGLNTYAFIINRRESGATDTGRAEDVLLENIQVGSAEKPFNDAVWLFGSTTLADFFHVNVTFSGNDFHVGRSALRTQTHTNTVFTGNVVSVYGTADAALIEAVRLNTPIETFTFTNNEIVFVGTTRAAATTFVGLNATNSLVNSVAVYNNTFTNAGFEGEGTEHSFVGFRHDGAASSATFGLYHNSFRLSETGNSGLQAAVGKNAGASGAASVNVVNNIVVNERDAENSYAYQWTGSGFSADYNNIVTNGSGGVALIDETRYASLAEFAGTTSNDTNSSTADVEFVSNTDLRLTGASIGDNRLGGTPLAMVTTDIDGKDRSGSAPYKGAFEGDVVLVPTLEAIGPFALLSPSDGFSLTLEGDAATEVEIQWEMPESSEAWARMGGTLEDDAFAHGGNGTNAQGKYLGMLLGQEAWVRSPKVVDPGTLSFWGATFSAATVLTLSVEISEDGEEWEELTSYAATAGDGGDITSSWQNKEIEVNREGAYYFRWRQHGEAVAGAAFIDDVELTVMGSAAVFEEDFEGWETFSELLFTWHVDLATGDFSEPLLSIPSDNSGSSNQLTLTYGAIDAAIASLGIEQGASANLQWTVTAELMENVRFAESPFAITITRSLGVSTEREEMPLVFSLSQNYPNPFNPTTSIKFTLPETIDVRLEVYNIAGQRVSTLVNSQMSAGEHVVSFDARALASGVYIYRIIAGDYVKSNKMTLIK